MSAASSYDPALFRTRQAVQAAGPPLSQDFPHGPTPRSVRFSVLSLLALTEPATDEERAARWYSQRELDYQKRRLRHDVIRLARRHASTSALLPKEELYNCVGHEACLSRDVFKSTKEHKERHVHAVLAAQARQLTADVRDEEELSRLSQASSAPTRARAHKIAVEYWHVLK